MWYEIFVKNYKRDDAYSEQELIKEYNDLVHGCGVDWDDIEIVTHISKEQA